MLFWHGLYNPKIGTITSIIKMSLSSLKIKNKDRYEDAVRTLNGLISNASIISKSVEKGPKIKLQHVPQTKAFCERAGVKLADIALLNVIHVAGTKGKGSTCAYIEAILRHHGFKTGLFTSPHLVEVRERIKINGSAISKSDFNNHFWNIYGKLYNSKISDEDLPFYFQFLTIMAFHVFLEEKVDYVIFETGIGGRFDSTNILPASKVACITSLGFDHMEILGNSLKEIAWNKAGIIKPGSLVVTCDSQSQDGLEVILNEVKSNKNELFLIPTKDQKCFSSFVKNSKYIHSENALLAGAVCHLILNHDDQIKPCPENNISAKYSNLSHVTHVPLEVCMKEEFEKVIRATSVTGRYQNLSRGNIDFFIDGAHTVESMATCVEWFKDVSSSKSYKHRFLIFMITGRRSVENLLSPLTKLSFDGILLSPLVPFRQCSLLDFALDDDIIAKEKAKLAEIAATWTRLNFIISESEESAHFFDNFEEINEWLLRLEGNVQVLVVGSLHLVGCALAVLDDDK